MVKKCPFCREVIQEDAIKCKHCGSSLLPAQPVPPQPDESPKPGPDQVQYILDKGLIRYGKFVFGVLAIFIAVGAYLWGYDIKYANDKANESLDKVRAIQDKIDKSADSINIKEAEIRLLRDSLDQAVIDARTTLTKVHANAQVIDSLTVALLSRGGLNKDPHVTKLPPVSSTQTSTTLKVLTVPQVAALYNFPTQFTGKGQTIGIIELSGGYKASDLQTYFTRLKLPIPQIIIVPVAGATNDPGNQADPQVIVDIEVAGAVAPQARIVVYFAPSTEQGFQAAIDQAVHDQTNKPSVISIGWGSAETVWTPKFMQTFNETLKEAAMAGITVVSASGDRGCTDGVADKKLHVDFPASSPYVLAVGGTKLTGNGEIVWNDASLFGATGGGASSVFPSPPWQKDIPLPPAVNGKGRGLPDVSASASPAPGYLMYFNNQWGQLGGTSLAAPLWAGLIALINQGIGKNVGYINPKLYGSIGPSGVLRDIKEGNNSMGGTRGFSAGPGWDACTGWGSPDGKKLMDALKELMK